MVIQVNKTSNNIHKIHKMAFSPVLLTEIFYGVGRGMESTKYQERAQTKLNKNH